MGREATVPPSVPGRYSRRYTSRYKSRYKVWCPKSFSLLHFRERATGFEPATSSLGNSPSPLPRSSPTPLATNILRLGGPFCKGTRTVA